MLDEGELGVVDVDAPLVGAGALDLVGLASLDSELFGGGCEQGAGLPVTHALELLGAAGADLLGVGGEEVGPLRSQSGAGGDGVVVAFGVPCGFQLGVQPAGVLGRGPIGPVNLGGEDAGGDLARVAVVELLPGR